MLKIVQRLLVSRQVIPAEGQLQVLAWYLLTIFKAGGQIQ